MHYSDTYEEIAKMIVNKNNGDPDSVKIIYIKDGKVNVETDE